MNSIIINEEDIEVIDSKEFYTLNEGQDNHMNNIVGIKVGKSLKGTILNKGLCDLVVNTMTPKISCEIVANLPGVESEIILLVGASRPQTMKKVIEHGASLGVTQFHVFKAELSDKSYLQSKVYEDSEFQKLSELGLSQSTCFFKSPKVIVHKNIHCALSHLANLNISNKLILSPFAKKGLIKHTSLLPNQPMVLAIGPERGWTDKELTLLVDNNFSEFNLGPSIMRVEIALFASLGVINQYFEN